MGIIKLQNAGESVTWLITNAETAAGNFGPQVKFENGTDTLYLPEDSAMRQLSRIGLDVAQCVGETLVISRDPNPKAGAKPYWGIRLAGAADKAPPSKRLPPPEKQGVAMGHVKGLDDFPDEEYGASVHSPSGPDDPYLPTGKAPTPHRVPQVPPKAAQEFPDAARATALANRYLDLLAYVKANGSLTDEQAVQSASATIWISWKDAGLR